MWLFTTKGFVSIVENTQNPKTFLVRSRFSNDIQQMFPGYPVKKTTNRDYLYRAEVPRGAVADQIRTLALVIDYPNFKDATPKARHDLYLRVWSILYNAQANVRRKVKQNLNLGSWYDNVAQTWPLPEDNRK